MIEEIPAVVWPRDGGWKVVQLYLDGKPYLRFAETVVGWHASILERFLVSNNIEYKKKEISFDYSRPEQESERYKATGMGEAKIDNVLKKASFFGRSIAYKIGIDQNHLNLIRQLFPDWTIES